MSFTLRIGDAAPDFDLPGTDGRRHALASFAQTRVLVVAFWCNHCPYVIGSEEKLIKLALRYGPEGVNVVAVNSNSTENHPDDSFEHMVRRATERNYPFVYLRDESQAVARAYGALRTPHFYVFDQGRRLRYTGRMDDNPKFPEKVTTHELQDAVEAVIAGRRPPVEVTNPIGCNVKWRGKPEKWMPPEACDLV